MSAMQNAYNHRPRSGFTVVEVLVIAPVVLLTIAAFIGVLIALTGEVLVARSSNTLAYDTQSGLNMIEHDIRRSGSFLATNNLNLTSPQGENNTSVAFQNATNRTNPRSDVLILNMIAITNSADRSATTPVWLRNSPYSCDDTRRQNNQVMTYNVVYFVDTSGTMWRRVIMPPTYTDTSTRCTEPDQRPSCMPGRTESICIAQDARVLNDVTSLKVRYFTSAGSTSPIASASDHTVSSDARNELFSGTTTAQIDISSTKPVAGQDVTYSSSVRSTRIGSLINY